MNIEQLATDLGLALKDKGWIATTAESSTGGGVAYAVTEIPGSSAWFNRSFVTYSNEAKQEMRKNCSRGDTGRVWCLTISEGVCI